MAKQDYYETLGVNRNSDEDALKSAYRKLAMKYHPDRNPDDTNAEHRFKQINEAYDVLKDPQKRAAYDRFGHEAFEGGMGGAAGAGFGGAGFTDIFEEVFGDFMGGRRSGGSGNQRGADLRFDMKISLQEAFRGRKTTISVPGSVACGTCSGTGAASGSHPTTCTTCRGRGRVRAQQGFFTVERTCAACGGTGRVIEDPCIDCHGSGRVRKNRSLSVTIPAGVEDGTRIRLAGEGEAGVRGAASGDLYIFLSIEDHPIFYRDGAAIQCEVPLPMTTAAMGGAIEVPTLDGPAVRVTIAPGTQTGTRYRLRGKGMSQLHSSARGDLYVDVKVETPVNLTARQKKLLEEFSHNQSEATSPQSTGFFERCKEIWEDLRD